jgi:hypothetical protein
MTVAPIIRYSLGRAKRAPDMGDLPDGKAIHAEAMSQRDGRMGGTGGADAHRGAILVWSAVLVKPAGSFVVSRRTPRWTVRGRAHMIDAEEVVG